MTRPALAYQNINTTKITTRPAPEGHPATARNTKPKITNVIETFWENTKQHIFFWNLLSERILPEGYSIIKSKWSAWKGGYSIMKRGVFHLEKHRWKGDTPLWKGGYSILKSVVFLETEYVRIIVTCIVKLFKGSAILGSFAVNDLPTIFHTEPL